MLRTIFLNSNKRLRNGWWIAIFLAILTALLFPLIILASYGDGRVPLYQQLGIILAASLSCQAMRRAPVGELLGALDLRWLRQLLLGLVLGALLMIVPAACRELACEPRRLDGASDNVCAFVDRRSG